MEKYCVIERKMHENHAGAKAREDIARILLKEQWIPFMVHHSEQKGTLDKLKMAFFTYKDWNYIYKHISPKSSLIIQYPLAMYPKVSMVAIPILRKIKRKEIKCIFLVHDLESLRGGDGEREKLFLDEADIIVAHNSSMIEYLKSIGYQDKTLISLEIFDYLIHGNKKRDVIADWKTVAIAGNLKKDKAGYVYLLDQLEGNVKFYLYGPNYEGADEGKNIEYKGQYPPEELPEKLEGGFGLVWDGTSLDECTGPIGEYLKYNNPHKTSLYLASGIPIIIWKKAAMAEFVNKKKVGIVVDSLKEISAKVEELSEKDYIQLKKNAEKVGAELRRGAMLKRVIRLL